MASTFPPSAALPPQTTPAEPVNTPPDNETTYPLAAQIPLSSFELPTFPPEASHLRALTLTSDIKLDEYQSLLGGREYELPQPPPSITHLTLELFSLGFPGRNPHFLANLARALPNLKSVTFFACLIDGLNDHSRDDALEFFQLLPVLREVHVIDSFVRPGFWTAVSKIWSSHLTAPPPNDSTTQANTRANSDPHLPAQSLEAEVESAPGVKVVEVSYTYRGHSDIDFLARVHGEELPRLVVPGIVGAGFNFSEARKDEMPPDQSESKANGETKGEKKTDEDEKEKQPESGILPFAPDSRATVAVKAHLASLTREPSSLAHLKVLNLGMWTLKPTELSQVLAPVAGTDGSEHPLEIIDLTVSVLLVKDWLSALVDVLKHLPALESLELIGVPSDAQHEGEDWFLSTAKLANDDSEVKKMGEAAPKLSKVEMSILRARKAGGVMWAKKDGEWKIGE